MIRILFIFVFNLNFFYGLQMKKVCNCFICRQIARPSPIGLPQDLFGVIHVHTAGFLASLRQSHLRYIAVPGNLLTMIPGNLDTMIPGYLGTWIAGYLACCYRCTRPWHGSCWTLLTVTCCTRGVKLTNSRNTLSLVLVWVINLFFFTILHR